MCHLSQLYFNNLRFERFLLKFTHNEKDVLRLLFNFDVAVSSEEGSGSFIKLMKKSHCHSITNAGNKFSGLRGLSTVQ